MSHRIGQIVLVVSGMGFPLTQGVLRRGGRGDALLVEVIVAGLLTRDVAMIAVGAPGRLRRGPAMMLWLEASVAAIATVMGIRLVFDPAARVHAAETRPTRFEGLRRAAVGTLFGLRTMRFRIDMAPDRGRRVAG